MPGDDDTLATTMAHTLGVTRTDAAIVLRYPGEFVLGMAEAGGSTGRTYDGSRISQRSIAYDLGRSLVDGEGPDGMHHLERARPTTSGLLRDRAAGSTSSTQPEGAS